MKTTWGPCAQPAPELSPQAAEALDIFHLCTSQVIVGADRILGVRHDVVTMKHDDVGVFVRDVDFWVMIQTLEQEYRSFVNPKREDEEV